MGQPTENIINEDDIKRRLKKTKNAKDLERSLKKELPNNVTNLIVTVNGDRRVSFEFRGKTHEIVV